MIILYRFISISNCIEIFKKVLSRNQNRDIVNDCDWTRWRTRLSREADWYSEDLKINNNIEQWRNEKKRRTRVTRCIITLSEESVLAGYACHREFWKLLANWIPTRHTTYMHMLARAILFYLYVARMCSFHACIQHSLYSFAPLKSSLHDYRNVFI